MKRLLLYVALALLIGTLVCFDSFMSGLSFVADRVQDLNNLQQKEVDTFLQMTSLLAGFATLTLGGIGALIWDTKKVGKASPQLVTATASSALSLYFGYISYRYLLWMLENQFFDLSHHLIATTSLLQFSAFLISLVFLADFVFASKTEKSSKREEPA